VDAHDLYINLGSAAAAGAVVAGGLVKALAVVYKEKLTGIENAVKGAATRDDLTKLEMRMNTVENRYHDEIRDLRTEMNGLGTRLEGAINAKLEPIQKMVQELVAALINGKP